MARPREKLTESLEVLRSLQDRGVVAVRSRDLSRTHRERLVRAGFLERVMKGWFISARPDEGAGESTAWYGSFWGFCAASHPQVSIKSLHLHSSPLSSKVWRLSRTASMMSSRPLWTVSAMPTG